jgi:hypothetical protein
MTNRDPTHDLCGARPMVKNSSLGLWVPIGRPRHAAWGMFVDQPLRSQSSGRLPEAPVARSI